MEARDKSFGFDFETTYNAIETGKSFTYTLNDGRIVSYLFETVEKGILVAINFETEN